MKYHAVEFLLIIILSFGVFAKDKITLNNSNEFISKIEKVNNWGLNLESNQSIHFKVISNIKTKNYSVVEKISQLFPEIALSVLSDSAYFLDFKDVIFKPSLSTNQPKIQQASIFLMYSTTQSENYELQFNYSPQFFKYFLSQVSFSAGTYDCTLPIDHINSYNFEYITTAFNIGIGGQYRFSNNSFQLTFNYSYKSITEEGYPSTRVYDYIGNRKREENSFLSIYYRYKFQNSLQFSIGSRYYFSDINTVYNYRTVTFNLGIGIDIFNN